MNVAEPFIRRPVATTLLTFAIAFAGAIAFAKLPAASRPEVDLPTITVSAQMSGASPEIMASSVATPLEHHLSAISSVTQMVSNSTTGSTKISLGFDLNRDINGAARDVEAAINAARADLPSGLTANPSYSKINTADAPVTYLSLTSQTLSLPGVFEAATTILVPRLASIEGVGKVDVLGSSPQAVRVELNPAALSKYGIGPEDVRAAIAAANANSPKGAVDTGQRRLQIYVNDIANRARDYRDLIIANRNGIAVKLSDVAEILDSVEEPRAMAFTNRTPSILLRVFRVPHANIVETVERISARLPQLRSILPPGIDITSVSDRTATIRASLHDLEQALFFAGGLVILTVYAFLQSARSTIIPLVVVPVSILATFCVMAAMKFSLDALSLMALIIATGLVIDDSVIVLENITRHIDAGIPALQASLQGVREVAFTVLATSLSLVTIFIPFLFMDDVTGRMLREFVVTLSAAVLISFVVSITTAPMLCALLLRPKSHARQGWLARYSEAGIGSLQRAYESTLAVTLTHNRVTILALGVFVISNIFLYVTVPKGLMPEQDPGWLIGEIDTGLNTPLDQLKDTLRRTVDIILDDPDVQDVNGQIYGASATNSAELHIHLKARNHRDASAKVVAARLSAAVSHITSAILDLYPPQDVHLSLETGGGDSYQYELQGDNIEDLRSWTRRLTDALKARPEILNPSDDQRESAFETRLVIDRGTASRLGISASQIDNTLADAFSQRRVTTTFDLSAPSQVVMEVAPEYRQSLTALEELYISTSGGAAGGVQTTNAPIGNVLSDTSAPAAATLTLAISSNAARNQALNSVGGRGQVSSGAAVSTAAEHMIPLATMIQLEHGVASLAVSHDNGAVVSHIRFHLAPDISADRGMAVVAQTAAQLYMPASIHQGFTGAIQAFQQTLFEEVALLIAVLVALYIVLGILYESFIHPLTILSTFFSVGIGALLALMLCHMEFTIIAFIGVILLTGIVMKNAIMMIDVALRLQREDGLIAHLAIFNACALRFRPIMMTTCGALFGALPLAIGTGDGAELRQPLGVSIVGGLLVSQALTLYTTPAVYLLFDRFGLRPRQTRTPHGATV